MAGNGGSLKRLGLLTAVPALVASSVMPGSALAGAAIQVTGGGAATISQFGMGITMSGSGSAQGHFECLMAGRSAVSGLALMAVQGQVTRGTLNSEGSVIFSGLARVTMNPAHGPGDILTDVPFIVAVSDGGAGSGTLQLTLPTLGMTLPVETVLSGRITVHS